MDGGGGGGLKVEHRKGINLSFFGGFMRSREFFIGSLWLRYVFI